MKVKEFLKLVTVEPVLFLYMLVIFLEMNTLQSLFYTKVCFMLSDNITQKENCSYESRFQNKNPQILLDTVLWNKYYNCCLTLSTLLVSFYVASWSDFFGRKTIMLIPPIGTLIASLMNAALSIFMDAHIAFFLLSGIVSGLSFGSVGIIASTFGFISDIVDEESRTKRIVILEAMIFSGGTIGIYVGGALLSRMNLEQIYNAYARVFTLEIVVAVVIILYVVLRIPSIVPSSELDEEEVSLVDQRTRCRKLFDLKHLKDVFRAVFRKRSGGKRRRIVLLMVALIFIYYGSSVQMLLSFLFVKNEPLSWSITQYSYYNAVQYAAEGLALLLGLPLAFHFLHLSDHFVALLGLVSRISGLLLFGLSTSGAMIYSCAVLFMLSEFPVPTTRSMLSKLVDENERGKIFAFTTILQNLCYFSASFILPTIFQATLHNFPGLCFEIVASLQVFAAGIFCFLHFDSKEIETTYVLSVNEDGSTTETCSSSVVKRELVYPS